MDCMPPFYHAGKLKESNHISRALKPGSLGRCFTRTPLCGLVVEKEENNVCQCK